MPTSTRALVIALLAALPSAATAAATDTVCFAYETETAAATLALELPEGDGEVAGRETGTIQDHEQGYFTSWESLIAGTRTGDTLAVTVETAIELDTQTETAVWALDGDTLVTDRNTYSRTNCPTAADGSSEYDEIPVPTSDDTPEE